MKKLKIGLPRAFSYYRNSVLWRSFFTQLGCKVVVSPDTNIDILNLGIKNTIDECCLSYKIYIGHVLYLSKFCDYVLVARICDYGKKDKVCTRFNGTYDFIKTLIPKSQILEYDICHTKFKYEFIGFFKIGLKITKNPFKILSSYLYAKSKQKKYNNEKSNEELNKLNKNNIKILIIAHDYNINDKYISSYIIEYLNNNNIVPIYANNLDKKIATSYAEYFSDTIYWKYAKEMIGSLYYFNHQINGVIYISTYPCGQDALVNNLAILKNKHLPTLNLIIDENITTLNLETKLESFIDILKGEKNNE